MSKINELGLQFNEKQMYIDLVNYLVEAVSDTAFELLGHFKQESTEAMDDLDLWSIGEVIFDSGTELIKTHVGSDHWLAFLDNYGTGSKMADASQNPFLSDYVNSPYFNKERLNHDMAVVGRPEGHYVKPNFRSGFGDVYRESKGHLEGLNLEELLNPRTNKPYFIPQEPKFWLEKNVEKIGDRLVANVKKAFSKFPFHNYLRGGFG